VLRYDPKNVEANYQSAVLLLEAGKYQRSLELLSHLPESIQRGAQQLSIACADYVGLGDKNRADNATSRLLTNTDFSELDAEQMLPALLAGKRDDLIISLYEGLQKRTALLPQGLSALGLAYDRMGRLPEARATLERFVSGGNLSVSSLLALAHVAYEQQDYQGSLGYLAHARDLAPTDASVHYFFGLVCLDLNLIAEARNSFEKAVSLRPENPSYNYAMGATSAYRHDPAEAVPYFEKYIKLKPEDPRGKLALGVALFRAKDYAGATPWLTQAAKIPQTATAAHYYLGSIDVQQRRLDEARDELELALQGKPDDADALAELGQCYLVQKDYARAEQQIQQALKIDPDHISANFYLLNLYIRTGDPRREAQAKRFDELQKLRDQKVQEFLRMVEVDPFKGP
jgi:tetratricopeptide (TPR) repeat protein